MFDEYRYLELIQQRMEEDQRRVALARLVMTTRPRRRGPLRVLQLIVGAFGPLLNVRRRSQAPLAAELEPPTGVE